MLRNKPLLHTRSLIWLVLLVLVLLADRFLPGSFWERYYYKGFFLVWRNAYDFLLGWSPVPTVYLVLGLILYRSFRWLKHREQGRLYRLSTALGGIASVVVLFYVLWAFNYRQMELPDRLGLDLRQVHAEEIQKEFLRASDELQQLAEALPPAMRTKEAITRKITDEAELRQQLEATLKTLGLPHSGRVRVRQLWPKGTLLRWSTAGIYIPQTGEGHIDMGLLSIQKPFTMAHEMAHGYGVAEERDCNFIAWLACRQSTHVWTRFCGALAYWRYAAAEMESSVVKERMASFPPIIDQALRLIHENNRKYPDLMPKLRDMIYSSYLRRHGVEGGLRSYNEVVLLVREYMEAQSNMNGIE
jgi:hypothetical protein